MVLLLLIGDFSQWEDDYDDHRGHGNEEVKWYGKKSGQKRETSKGSRVLLGYVGWQHTCTTRSSTETRL